MRTPCIKAWIKLNLSLLLLETGVDAGSSKMVDFAVVWRKVVVGVVPVVGVDPDVDEMVVATLGGVVGGPVVVFELTTKTWKFYSYQLKWHTAQLNKFLKVTDIFNVFGRHKIFPRWSPSSKLSKTIKIHIFLRNIFMASKNYDTAG